MQELFSEEPLTSPSTCTLVFQLNKYLINIEKLEKNSTNNPHKLRSSLRKTNISETFFNGH